MANYNNGKIYMLRNHDNEKVYIGMTTQSLSLRLAQHKLNSLNQTVTKIKIPKIDQAIKSLGFDKFYIELLTPCPCKSRDELVREQNKHIRQLDTWNNGLNGFVQNEISIKTEPAKTWINNITFEPKKHTCKICDCDMSISSKIRHERSKKHEYNIINKIVDKNIQTYHKNIGTVLL
jgi:hypothetical protein